MTTVVYRDGVLAGDTLITAGSWRWPSPSAKVVKLADGRLFGGAGVIGLIQRFKSWLEKGAEGDQPSLGTEDEETTVIVVAPNRRVTIYCGELPPWEAGEQEYYAIGSGRSVALGALYMGATAEKAAEAAVAVDIASGGPVQSVRLAE